jgi:hypothetical protein
MQAAVSRARAAGIVQPSPSFDQAQDDGVLMRAGHTKLAVT